MTPANTVLPGSNAKQIVFASNQPQYKALPAVREADGRVTTRWKASFGERLLILLTGDIYLQQLTFNTPLQPVKLLANPPKIMYSWPGEEY